MQIVLEGPDNSGKSTLARYLSTTISRSIVGSEGPEKYPGEINDRTRRYFSYGPVIFDRHPCVSQPIYGRTRHNTAIDPDLMLRFYDMRPLFIYARGRGKGLDGHKINPNDTAEHLKAVEASYDSLCRWYDEWALQHAHITYRVGDSMERINQLVIGALR